MTPEQEQRLEAVERKLDELISMLNSAPAYTADVSRALGIVVGDSVLGASAASPASYDKAVDEAGASSYNVADVFDGFYESPDGKLIGYYNP